MKTIPAIAELQAVADRNGWTLCQLCDSVQLGRFVIYRKADARLTIDVCPLDDSVRGTLSVAGRRYDVKRGGGEAVMDLITNDQWLGG